MRHKEEGHAAHRPRHAHAEVVGVLVLALTSVPRERAALLWEEAATSARRSRRRRLENKRRRRCVQESGDAHCEERRRHSALEPISKQLPAAQRLFDAGRSKPIAMISSRGRSGVGAHSCVTALKAEIVGGTLPEKRFSLRYLRRSVLVRTPDSAGRPHGRRRGVQLDQPGERRERRDAREDRAGEAVLTQVPDCEQ
jgi:hypothetical protein